MGKVTGFLEYPRREPGYRPVAERLRDHRAVEQQLSHAEVQRQAARCMDCGTPFCHAFGCPLGNIIPEWNDWVYRGMYHEALELLLATNNFPEFTGRVCPAPCEAACVAGIGWDPVTIRQIELTVIEKGFEADWIHPLRPPVRHRERVAVIGAGPAGLAVADTLNQSGYAVTVFDSARRPGGLLRYGIPDFKLEKWVVDRRIALMEKEGVVFEPGVRVGEDLSYHYLRDRHRAVCLACGARAPRDLKVPGRGLQGIHFAMDYLTEQNRRVSGELPPSAGGIRAEGKRVVVIGGGDTGSDCVGTAIRQGAREVLQFEILPKPPRERPASTPWPMWPNILRESHAHKEGCGRRWSVTTRAFTGRDGVLTGLQCAEVVWESVDEGRPPVPREVPGTDFEVEADLVFLAMGFLGPRENRMLEELGVARDARGNVCADAHHMTSVDGLFVAGDMRQGQSLVVRAIADGRRAAEGIMAYLKRCGC